MARIKLAADFNDFLNLCLSHEIRFMVIGGYAVVHYSRPRYTWDFKVNKRKSGRPKDLQDLEELP